MKNILKRLFSRPMQAVSYLVVALATNHLMPDDPDVVQWVAYGFIYVAMLAVSIDNYTEGLQTGIKIMKGLS